jgi:uncharacterized membrane protein YvbJ
MSLKQCGKCSEMVDEAKAFCPDCGHPFVAEQVRQKLTEHDSFDGTLKLSQSAYNIMLSEMELDITEQPEAKKAPAPPSTDTGKKDESVSKRPLIIGIGILLIVVIIILVFFVAQPFSK